VKLFWIGVLCAPIPWLITVWFLWWLSKQRKNIREWYMGLPLVQWPAMLLVVLGTKVLQRKHCEIMRYNGRVWYSPLVKGFNVDE
jgi:hypothetical protein